MRIRPAVARRARVLGACATVALFGAAGPVGVAAAAPPVPQTQCSLADPALAEVSGLVADGERWYVVNDGGSDLRVYVLARDCTLLDVIVDDADPFDVEDLARGRDGTFWLADVGDNRGARDTVAVHALRPGGGSAAESESESGPGPGPGSGSTLYRMTYFDGAHDAEALLLDRSGTPHIITKSVTGASAIYRPAQRLRAPGPTPLEKVGDVPLSLTGTPGGPVAVGGSLMVTGAATSHDGRVVALRTYTDAYLYAVPDDGDVVAALTGEGGSEPVRVPLPDEPQGEALAFEPDGTLVSMSEGSGTAVRTVPGAASLVTDAAPQQRGPGRSGDARPRDPASSDDDGGRGAAAEAGSRARDSESGSDGHEDGGAEGFPAGAVTVGALAAVAVAAGTVGILRRRRS
ncbi:hypothetical protein HQ32_02081 [Prauserella sp. Am3]|nr:hypothetical protein HQ32_02081 [Prauserella sp. Am3]